MVGETFNTFTDIATKAVHVDNLLFQMGIPRQQQLRPQLPQNPQQRQQPYQRPFPNPNPNPLPIPRDPRAMDVDALAAQQPRVGARPPLTPEERQRRLNNNLCLYCAGNHMRANCPLARPIIAALHVPMPPIPGYVAPVPADGLQGPVNQDF